MTLSSSSTRGEHVAEVSKEALSGHFVYDIAISRETLGEDINIEGNSSSWNLLLNKSLCYFNGLSNILFCSKT